MASFQFSSPHLEIRLAESGQRVAPRCLPEERRAALGHALPGNDASVDQPKPIAVTVHRVQVIPRALLAVALSGHILAPRSLELLLESAQELDADGFVGVSIQGLTRVARFGRRVCYSGLRPLFSSRCMTLRHHAPG